MLKRIDNLLQKRFFWIITSILFLFGTFPGKGGFEGGQREFTTLSERSDNWGFMTPFFYGEWPNFLGHWRFTIVLFQLSIYWIGFILFFRHRWPTTPLMRILLAIYLVFSSTFASQLWRDATLFSFVFFGISLLRFCTSLKDSKSKVLISIIGAISIFFGSCFKPAYAPLIILFAALPYLTKFQLTKLKFLVTVILLATISSVPYLSDKYLSNHMKLVRTYPEQQPMIYDMASMYCWGNSSRANLAGENALKLVLNDGIPVPSVCASLILTSWDNLHMPMKDWIYKSPLKRLQGEERDKFKELRNLWLNAIIQNPREYLLVKLPFTTQVLTMANSFVKPVQSWPIANQLLNRFNEFIWNIFYFFSVILDKLRLFTLGFAFLIGFILFLRNSNFVDNSLILNIKNNIRIVYLLLFLLTTLLLVTFAFVAANGRYVLPFVLLFYAELLLNDQNINVGVTGFEPAAS